MSPAAKIGRCSSPATASWVPAAPSLAIAPPEACGPRHACSPAKARSENSEPWGGPCAAGLASEDIAQVREEASSRPSHRLPAQEPLRQVKHTHAQKQVYSPSGATWQSCRSSGIATVCCGTAECIAQRCIDGGMQTQVPARRRVERGGAVRLTGGIAATSLLATFRALPLSRGARSSGLRGR
jgi:hypothetical protein